MEVRLDGKVGLGSEFGHASPTTTLKNDIVTALLTDSTVLTGINKLVVVDSAGTERDSVAVSSTDFTAISGGYQVSKQFTATASYTATKVRAYSGTKLYFEGSLPSSVSVVSGVPYTLTFSYTVSLSVSITTSPSTVQSISYTIHDFIARMLKGESYDIRVSYAEYVDSAGSVIFDKALTVDSVNKTFGHAATNFPVDATLAQIIIVCVYSSARITISISPINVTTADTISMSFTVSA